MKLFRPVATLACLAAALFLWALPSASRLDPGAILRAMPDADLRSYAEQLWSENDPDSALMLLEYIVEAGMPDSPAAQQQHSVYLAELKADASPLGRLRSAGSGFATGRVRNWESLAGSSLGDLMVYGDLRDITRELVFEDEADDFIVALSTIGVLATVFPPAEPAISLIKALKKTGALSERLSAQLRQAFKLSHELPAETARVEKLRTTLTPLYELSKQTRSWSEFKTLVKHADSLDQMKALTKIASHQPGNGRKTAQILLVAGQRTRAHASEALDFILTHGQRGMDTLYSAIRKGPLGLRHVAAHPALVAHGVKITTKSAAWIHQKWAEASRRWGLWADTARLGALALCGAFLFTLCAPRRWFQPPNPAKSPHPAKPPVGIRSRAWAAAGVGAGFVLVALAIPAVGGSSTAPAYAELGSEGRLQSSLILNLLAALLALGIQGWIWRVVRARLRQIELDPGPLRLRLQRAENLDVFLDLPLYTGLAFTIFAFILISLDAGMSRILAYSSTVIGILSALSLRIQFLHPLKDRLCVELHAQRENFDLDRHL